MLFLLFIESSFLHDLEEEGEERDMRRRRREKEEVRGKANELRMRMRKRHEREMSNDEGMNKGIYKDVKAMLNEGKKLR